MKKVCLDIRALQIGHQNRGIGMYIKSVLEHLPDDGTHYLLYCFDKNDPVKSLKIDMKVKYTLVQTTTINTVLDSPKNILGIFKLIGHRFSALAPYEPDSFVQFDFMLGLPRWRNTKTIVIGYDLIPLIMKNEYMPSILYAWHHSHGKKAKLKGVLRSVYYRFRYKVHYRVFKRADTVLCISKAAADSFKEILGINEKKIATAPLAPVLASGDLSETVSSKIKKPYVFYIGGTDSRKKIQDIVYAFNIARGRGQDLALVLAGNEFKELERVPDVKGRNAILNSPYKKDIHLVGFVTDEEKIGLYKSARAFVFTTTYEGFGLPVVEAMSASCPVIAYNNSSIPEAAGEAAILVKTGDYVSVANAIISLEDASARKKLITYGLTQSSSFNWQRYVAIFTSQF